jgi:hypothetical protein
MKKHLHPSLKFHTLYTIGLVAIFLVILVFVPDIILAASVVLFVLYVGGNGIIHAKKNQLSRDSIIEYILVAIMVAMLVAGAVLQ